MRSVLALVVGLAPLAAAAAQPAPAQPPPPPADRFPYRADGCLLVDAGVVVGAPTALPTGMTAGVSGGASGGAGPAARWLRLGGRAAVTTATESDVAWTVTHREVLARATATVRHTAGRGEIGLRLGLGGSLLHERRHRNQGERAGLEGDDLETTALALVPALDVELVADLAVVGPWGLQLAAGPSVARVDGAVSARWLASVGVSWRR